jgi:hypothetical protein
MQIPSIKKNQTIISKLLLLSLSVMLLALSSCYYDNEEALYPVRPSSNDCDTVAPTYSVTIQPIIQDNCLGCHSGSDPYAGLNLSTLDNLKTAINNNNLMNHVRENGYSIMPPSGSLSECNIKELNAWIVNGMLAK